MVAPPEIRHGLYELAGGREGFYRLVAAMHERVIRDDILGPLFADADHLVPVTEFFVGAFGGEGDPDAPEVRAVFAAWLEWGTRSALLAARDEPVPQPPGWLLAALDKPSRPLTERSAWRM
ncbi:hypothetical protein [Streptomyces sp. NPDC021622]|uniref:hypothetical protein n=1 Tax=Streptomyces sp. NPDC021622 TaxID=3155013 RepID=UPI0033E5061F